MTLGREIGGWSAADLARFIEQKLEEPGVLNLANIVGNLDVAQVTGIDFGVATLTYPGGSASATVDAAHGLGAEPSGAIVTADRSAAGALTNCSAGDFTDEQITIEGHTIDGSLPAGSTEVAVSWVVFA